MVLPPRYRIEASIVLIEGVLLVLGGLVFISVFYIIGFVALVVGSALIHTSVISFQRGGAVG